MPRNARCVWPGLVYHVTQRGTNHQRVFYSVTDSKVYLDLLRNEREYAAVRVLAYCLMTNHVHLLLVPERPDSLAELLQRVHGRYAQYLNAKRLRTGHLWQNRFFSCAVERDRLAVAVRYVELNPVRAGMADHAEDYRWSSAQAHLGGMDRSALLDQEFWCDFGGAPAWTELLGQVEDAAEELRLRRCTYAGRPYGTEGFIQQMEERFGRNWRRVTGEGQVRAAGCQSHNCEF